MAIHDPFKIPTAEQELLAENERLKAELKDAIQQHNEVALEACNLRSQVAKLQAAQTSKTVNPSDLVTSQPKATDPVFEHMRRTALDFESQVKELKAAHTPRPMSEAPETGTVRIVRDVDAQYIVAMCPRPDGWLPLPVDQGES